MKIITLTIAALASLVLPAGNCTAACTAVDEAGAGLRRPIVAIPDYLPTNDLVAAKRGMTEAILKAGFLPIVLPEMDDAAADQFLSRCDAVMIGGGTKGQDYQRRCAYEERIVSLAMKRGLPIAGICHGCQVINRYFGGKVAPVPADGKIVHKDDAFFARTGERAEHMAEVLPGPSLMADVFGAGALKINSSHKMRCLTAAPGFRVTATAPDGVIEALEHERLPICCFQFHPEYYWKKDARFLDLLRRALTTRKSAR
jgi:putative glutamine amidotransferase